MDSSHAHSASEGKGTLEITTHLLLLPSLSPDIHVPAAAAGNLYNIYIAYNKFGCWRKAIINLKPVPSIKKQCKHSSRTV